jgi:hypothetical protein
METITAWNSSSSPLFTRVYKETVKGIKFEFDRLGVM